VSRTKRGLTSLRPYLELFVQEAQEMYKDGFIVWDAATKARFRLRVKLLYVAGDYPGIG
jgi:hypothetical protein